jgi:hypothetical protein
MMKSTAMAPVVALATFTAQAAMARPYGGHSHHAPPRVTKTVRGPGFAGAYPVGAGYARPHSASPNWGSECVTDEGQGRIQTVSHDSYNLSSLCNAYPAIASSLLKPVRMVFGPKLEASPSLNASSSCRSDVDAAT